MVVSSGCLAELYFSRRAWRGWSSGLQRHLTVIRVFFFSLSLPSLPHTHETLLSSPSLFDLVSDPGHWVLCSTRFGRPSSQVHFGGVWLQLSLRSVRSVPFREDPGGCFPFLSDLLARWVFVELHSPFSVSFCLLPVSALRYLFSQS